MNTPQSLLVLPTLVALASPVFGQVIFGGSSSTGGIQNHEDVYACQSSGGGSRIKQNCEREERARAEGLQLPSVKLGPLIAPQCEAIATTEYFQEGAKAHVDSTLHISDCTAASGTLTFSVRTRDDNGAITPLEFDETWQQSDGNDVKLGGVYPIGENVLLSSVRVRNLRCTCDDASAAQASADSAPQPASVDSSSESADAEAPAQ